MALVGYTTKESASTTFQVLHQEKTFEASVSAQCFLGCWAGASPCPPWRGGLALCSEPGVQPGAHLPIPGENTIPRVVMTLLSSLG